MNSEQNPLRIDWLPTDRWAGKLGLTLALGKKGDFMGNAHWRDMTTDMQAAKAAGVQVVVNLMETDEMTLWQMQDYFDIAREMGLETLHFPIRDRDVPEDRAVFDHFVTEVLGRLQAGQTVLVHCLGGLGRTGTLAAALLVKTGMPTKAAIAEVRKYRSPKALEAQQPEFINQYFQDLYR